MLPKNVLNHLVWVWRFCNSSVWKVSWFGFVLSGLSFIFFEWFDFKLLSLILLNWTEPSPIVSWNHVRSQTSELLVTKPLCLGIMLPFTWCPKENNWNFTYTNLPLNTSSITKQITKPCAYPLIHMQVMPMVVLKESWILEEDWCQERNEWQH